MASWTAAVQNAAPETPNARILVLDIASGHLIGARHLDEAARTLAAPGSTLKPLALYGLVARGRWDPARRVACSRRLRIGGRSLDCSHPASGPMDARDALAWSCNSYFASVARTLAPGELRALLAPTGLLGQTGLLAQTGLVDGTRGGEAVADLRDPLTEDQNSLALLGVDAWGGVPVAGKTGTANLGPGTGSHGWFVGLVPAEHPTVVLAVYLPAGRGADAATVAAEVLKNSPLRSGRR